MDQEYHYFDCSMRLAGDWLEKETKEWIFQNHAWYLETDAQYSYFLFFYKETASLTRIILFVFDQKDQVIADLCAYVSDGASFLSSKEIDDLFSEESDWMYLEHWIAAREFYPQCSDPHGNETRNQEEAERAYGKDQLIFFSNAYVTKAYRNQGIFHQMCGILKDYVLDQCEEGEFDLFQVISLDPDIACYGPDANGEEYHYTFAKDEPKRAINRNILKKMGFTILYLEENPPLPQSDGCKIQFAVKKERIRIIDGINRA